MGRGGAGRGGAGRGGAVDIDAALLVQFQESPSHLTDRGHDSLHILFDAYGSHYQNEMK